MKRPIKLYESSETNFKHNKWVLSEVLSCYITENVDGQLQIDLEYPLFDSKFLAQYLIRGNIIKAPVNDNRPDQLFKIRKSTKNTDGTKVIVYGEAIARTDADNNYIPGLEVPAGKTRKQAMQIILDKRADKRRTYTIGNLDTSSNSNVNLGLNDDTGEVINYVDIADKSLLKAILEESTDKTNSSIYTAYKGEVIWNNFEINMVDERGKDNSFVIKSGKNLESLEEEISDMDDTFATALIMKSSDGLFLPNQEIIYSSNANKYDRYFYKTITCDDVSLEDLVTEDSSDADVEKAKQIVYEQLRERAAKQFANGIDKPTTNYTINFIQLADSEEYKDFAHLEKCELGNNVTTIYSKIGVRAESRVLSIKYNVITDKIEEVEIGDRLKPDITTTINNTSSKVESVKEDATDTKYKFKKNKKKVDAEIQNLGDEILLRVQYKEFASQINLHYDSILLAVNDDRNGTDVIIDTSGLGVHNGKLKIYNESDELCFWVSKNGQLFTSRSLDIQDPNTNDDLMSLNDTRLYWYTSRGIRGIEATSKGIDVKGNLYINGSSLDSIIEDIVSDYISAE